MATADDHQELPSIVPGGWLGVAFLVAVVAFAFVVIIGEAVTPMDTTRLPPPASTPPTTVLIDIVNGDAVPINCSQVELRLQQCP